METREKFGKIYFGYPVNFYNTPKEAELMAAIQKEFQNFSIESPNLPLHQEGYRAYKAERGDGVLYFFEKVLPEMVAGVFLPFEDGMLGAGVFREAEFMHQIGKLVFEISLEGRIWTMKLDSSRRLSVEETRKRVYEG